ncbi:MAG: hypothetical protein ACT4P6_06875 [Gemmatimonadaceae bacterium]
MRLWREHVAIIAVCGGVCLGGLTSAAAAAWRAWRIEPLPTPAAPYEWSTAALQEATVRPANIEEVLDADPFRFGAQASASTDSADRSETVVAHQCRLIGTVVGLDGESFATCDVGGVPRLVRQGQKIGAWTLLRVEQGQVVFRDEKGAPVTLKIAQPGGGGVR